MPRLLRSRFSARTERVEVASSGDQGHSNAQLPEAAGARGHASQLPALVGLVVGIGALGRLVGLRRVRVEGPSMLPTLDEGERLLVRRVRHLRVGDLVVSRPPGDGDGPLVVKRIAHIDGEGVHLRGDNPGASTDSRQFGAVRRGDVLGVAFYRYAPSTARLARGPR